MTDKAAYEVVKTTGHAMSMSTMKFGDTVHFDIKHIESGEVAWSSKSYWADAGARSIAGLRLAAAKMIKRYEYHLQKTGKRFEVTEREERAAKYLAKKTADRIGWLERNIPKLQAELAAAKAGAEFNQRDGHFVCDAYPVKKTAA